MHIIKPFLWPKHLKANHHGPWNLRVLFYHSSEEPNEEFSSEWYRRAFPKLWKLSHALRNVAEVDGRLVHIDDDSTIRDENVIHKMYAFKSLARAFLGSPAMQRASNNEVVATSSAMVLPKTCFSKADERERLILNSLTKVCNYLNISAQQRKSVRLTICPQVTHQRIWIGALEEILRGLKSEMESLNNRIPPKAAHMAEQIVTSCLCFLADTAVSSDPDSVSWIRLHPTEKANSVPSHQWGDILEMFNDLTKCLRGEMKILYHMSKVEVMKEGLFQIKDVLLDRDLGYKEARHQESLVQKKLSKSLGHSSQCLFTLLQYYLYGHVQDSEVDFCGGVYKGVVKGSSCLCIGKILTSNEEKVVWSAVKQLDRALGLFRFVWETAGMKEVLELQGHLWYVGTEKRTLTYRGNVFFLHTIRI
ncbi:uncharacterized protein LOC122080114 [Macadamia integrifolia]|uniref:uncharacterized protein LOC122080114 n=1 Tax=Macadamia integrifolia TaxID=60698 RepID=UPI001C4E7B72|nr:uncharacterized protein LOC122080114 [Macadamia integrifolia]XP_042502932.1 uncharacterized protein LOC122080114 [Macadamia integrifolia]XP_042502933.1 uncharacterized protein LOC122080114 [Macadamia integrifolia]XP_042502934.1 uncharacterized protein LOC122080114 [Macadamia integrifolia]XP_042502936.1 uncharacterized protein LOC122080114 [Macadamia integrifolia]XP_042502937.1 uncharacterized protein LOC122080114 [Macadamia integrifolia]XP_042502938.1 uncharacterized protein LOC122080114 [